MKLAQRLLSAALSGLCLFGVAQPSHAHHVPLRPANAADTVRLLKVAKALGVEVFIDKANTSAKTRCEATPGLLGEANRHNQLLICATANRTDEEIADTVRHELWHIAQYCKAKRVGTTIALVQPDLQGKALSFAVNSLHMPASRYPEVMLDYEAEARVAAQFLDEAQIAAILEKECGGQATS